MDHLARFQMNGLRALSALSRYGTLSKAASHLCVSPGAISKQVVRIEEQLGHRVFDRTSDGFVPVQDYHGFLEELSGGFDRIDSALSLLDSRKSKELRVTVAPGLAKSWLVSRLGNFCSTNDDIHLTVDSSHDLADLRNGQFSYGVRFGLGSWSGLRASKLMDLELFPVCAPALLGKLESIQDLEQVPIIFGEEGGSGWPLWLTAAGASRLNLKERSMMSSPDLCIEAAISGMGVTLVWQTMALDALDAGDLVVPFPITAKTGEAYWLVEPESRSSSAAARHFRKWLKDEFQVSQSKYEKLVGAGRLRSSME